MPESLPAPDPRRRELLSTVRRTIAELERAVHDLLESCWEEPERRRAHDMAVALTDACRGDADLRDLGGVARAAASLLNLRADDLLDIQDVVREKILDLIELLKETGGDESESA